MEGYVCDITYSSKELTKKESIMLKDLGNAVAIDSTLENENDEFIISPVAYAVLNIHNDKSKGDKNYIKYVILDDSGNKYVTGSNSFFERFKAIFDEMDGEEFQISVYRKPSRNYGGKYFISCSLVG